MQVPAAGSEKRTADHEDFHSEFSISCTLALIVKTRDAWQMRQVTKKDKGMDHGDERESTKNLLREQMVNLLKK